MRLVEKLMVQAEIATAALILAVIMGATNTAAADRQVQHSIAFQSGEITAINESTIQIDGRVFGLADGVILQDEKGREIEPSSLVVTAEVKYHVKKEQSNKIDFMIVYLPR